MRLGIGYLFSILRIYVPRLGFSIPSLGIEKPSLGKKLFLSSFVFQYWLPGFLVLRLSIFSANAHYWRVWMLLLQISVPPMSISIDKKQKYEKSNNNYKLSINNTTTFKNIQILIFERNFVIISKANSPSIHFVIHHPKLRNAIENFIPPIVE